MTGLLRGGPVFPDRPRDTGDPVFGWVAPFAAIARNGRPFSLWCSHKWTAEQLRLTRLHVGAYRFTSSLISTSKETVPSRVVFRTRGRQPSLAPPFA